MVIFFFERTIMFNTSPLHHVFTPEEEVEILNMFEENMEYIEGIEDALEKLNDPRFDSPVWDDNREKLKEMRIRLLDANYKCQVILITVGLMV